MPTLLAIVADTHTGSTVGLCPPRVPLDDGGEYHPSPGQRRLWGMWVEYWQEVKTQAGATPITVILNGDMVEGDAKNRSYQVVTRNKSDLIKLAAATLEPALSIADRAYFVRGTGAHSGKSATLEEQLAGDCDIAVKNEQDNASWWRLYGEVESVRLMVQHHGPPPGRKPWARLNPLMTWAYQLSQLKPPVHLSIAAHNHRWADTGDAYPARHISLPCWQLATEYTYRLGLVEPPDIGGLIVRCEAGSYTVQAVRYDQPRTQTRKL